MNLFLNAIFTLLTTSPGSLVYHMVLAFSVAGALQGAFNYWRISNSIQGKRMVIGLSALLVLRVALFLSAGLSWQELINVKVLLPVIDRTVTLLSLVIIIWLWAFPVNQRHADTAAILVGLLVITLMVMSGVWWSGQAGGADFNGSWPDTICEVSALVLTAMGLVLSAALRPAGYEYGLAMMALMFVGHLVQLIYPQAGGDYPGAVRLAQMTAYPLLLYLPQRSSIEAGSLVTPPAQAGQAEDGFARQALVNYAALFSDPEPKKICQKFTEVTARAFNADQCFLIEAGKPQGPAAVACGYDTVRNRRLENLTIDSQAIPTVVSALEKGRALRLPASSASPDLVALVQVLDGKKTAHLMAAPVEIIGGEAIYGLVLLSSADQGWTGNDQAALVKTSELLAYILQQDLQQKHLENSIEESRAEGQSLKAGQEQARQEADKLHAQLSQMQQSAEKDRLQLAGLTAMVAAQEGAQTLIARLQEENTALKQSQEEMASLKPDLERLKQVDKQLAALQAENMVLQGLQGDLQHLREENDGLILQVQKAAQLESEVAGLREGEQVLRQVKAENESLKQLQQVVGQLKAENEALRKSQVQAVEAAESEAVKRLQQTISRLRIDNEGLRQAQDQMGDFQAENVKLKQALEAMAQFEEDIAGLQIENANLKQALADVPETLDVEYYEKELRLALEEAAHLKAALSEADQRILALEKEVSQPSSREQEQAITAIVQELKQPMSSVVGYTDFLLGESIGILGALQRKFLERIKVSTERMERLLDELIQLGDLQAGSLQQSAETIDLSAAIDDAIAAAGPQLREKNISLRVDLPPSLPRIKVERETLQQILIQLIQNAGQVTASEGEVSLHVRVEKSEGKQDYVLMQVTDAGTGIPADELPQVFSRVHRSEHAVVQGVGMPGVSLSGVKSMVEGLQGRIWVDSEPGHGATFSVLLPVPGADSQPSNGWKGKAK